MSTNVGVLDACFRLAAGLALLAWGYGEFGPALAEMTAWIVWIAGLTLGLTGFFRYCPLYGLFGTNSCAIYPHEDGR